jgi:hypothetical protein
MEVFNMRFKKTDIETHSDNGYGAGYPAVKVKVYHVDCDTSDVIAMFPTCTEAQAEKALEFAFISECESFWDYWADTTGGNENGITGAYFPGDRPRVYSAGRSGGWLIVQGLAPVEDWDAVMVARWAKFEKSVKADIKYRMSKDALLEGIESNSWWKFGSSQYNYCDTDKGTVCLADVRQDVNDYAEAKHGVSLHQLAG